MCPRSHNILMAYAHKKMNCRADETICLLLVLPCFQCQMLCRIAALYRLAHQTYVPRKLFITVIPRKDRWCADQQSAKHLGTKLVGLNALKN